MYYRAIDPVDVGYLAGLVVAAEKEVLAVRGERGTGLTELAVDLRWEVHWSLPGTVGETEGDVDVTLAEVFPLNPRE